MSYLKLGVLALLMTVMSLPGSDPARAQEKPAAGGELPFAVEPAAGSSTGEVGSYFVIDLKPGDQVTERLLVRNDSEQPIELQLAAADAVTGPYGGVSYGNPGDPVDNVGTWISLEDASVPLEPGEQREVTFTVHVPADADSGVHIGGLAAWVPEARMEPEAEDEDDTGVNIDVQRRRVVAVQLVLPGPAEPLLRVTGIEPAARADGVYLLITIDNEGRGFAKGEGVIEVADPPFRYEFALDTFVPGTQIAYPVRFADETPEREYTARVHLDYGMWSETWEGTFVVGPDLTAELQDREPRAADPLPWWTLVVAGLAALVTGVCWTTVRGFSRGGGAPTARPARDSHRRGSSSRRSRGAPTSWSTAAPRSVRSDEEPPLPPGSRL